MLQQAVLPARIDDDGGAHVAVAAVLAQADARRAVALEQHVDHADPFVDVDAVLACVVEHQLVELASDHLPRL